MTTITTDLGGYGSYAGSADPADDVANYLTDFAGDYDVPGLVDAYRGAIKAELDGTGISLAGSDFFGAYPAREDAGDLIRAAIAAVDLGTLAQQYDTGAE